MALAHRFFDQAHLHGPLAAGSGEDFATDAEPPRVVHLTEEGPGDDVEDAGDNVSDAVDHVPTPGDNVEDADVEDNVPTPGDNAEDHVPTAGDNDEDELKSISPPPADRDEDDDDDDDDSHLCPIQREIKAQKVCPVCRRPLTAETLQWCTNYMAWLHNTCFEL